LNDINTIRKFGSIDRDFTFKILFIENLFSGPVMNAYEESVNVSMIYPPSGVCTTDFAVLAPDSPKDFLPLYIFESI